MTDRRGGRVPKDLLGRPVITAADLDAMTPEQRKVAFDASVITDLAVLPSEYVTRLRAGAEELVARRDAAQRGIASAS